MNTRLTAAAAALTGLLASPASAQAPATAPLVLHMPSSARTSALGNAWVAGRDSDVIFYNPAQLIGARQELGVSILRPGRAGAGTSISSVYAAGKWSLTLGWGAQLVGFDVDPTSPYPYPSDVLLSRGSADGQSMLLTFGGAIVYRNFRIGAAGKFVSDRVATPPGDETPVSIGQHAWLGDIGVARNLLGGVAAFSVQNLGNTSTGDPSRLVTPRQFVGGYSMTRPLGPLDLGMYGQVAGRKDWVAPAGGLEVGYSWIEGYSVAVRVGATRPETTTELPVSFGVGLTADRLTVEYAARFYEGGRAGSVVTIRWR